MQSNRFFPVSRQTIAMKALLSIYWQCVRQHAALYTVIGSSIAICTLILFSVTADMSCAMRHIAGIHLSVISSFSPSKRMHPTVVWLWHSGSTIIDLFVIFVILVSHTAWSRTHPLNQSCGVKLIVAQNPTASRKCHRLKDWYAEQPRPPPKPLHTQPSYSYYILHRHFQSFKRHSKAYQTALTSFSRLQNRSAPVLWSA